MPAVWRPLTGPSWRPPTTPQAKLKEIEERLERYRSPFRTAEPFLVEEIIDPRETRPLLCEFANLAAPLLKPGRPSFGVRP